MSEDNKKSDQKPQEKPQRSVMDKMLDNVGNLSNYFQLIWHRVNNVEQTNMELGLKHMREGNYFDAALRFKYVCWKNKKNFIAHYLQGKAYTYAGKPEKAIPPLRAALKNNPDLEEAKFLLASCGDNIKTERMPPSMIIEHLDMIADSYDDQIAKRHNVKVNQALLNNINNIYDDQQGFEVLDLDCRTGDAASIIVEKTNYIVGVDPSLKMISKARNRRQSDRLIYNQLASKLPLDFLKTNDKKFDIVLNTFSMFNYGDLSEHFKMIADVLKPKGTFIFNVASKQGEGYTFNPPNITFMHSDDYINKLAKANGLEITAKEYFQYERSADETFFVARKK